jgi:hypothetical protein
MHDPDASLQMDEDVLPIRYPKATSCTIFSQAEILSFPTSDVITNQLFKLTFSI